MDRGIKKRYITAAVVCIITLILVVIYAMSGAKYHTISQMSGDIEPIALDSVNNELTMDLEVPDGMVGISGIRLLVSTYGGTREGEIIVTLTEDGNEIYTWNRDTFSMRDDSVITFKVKGYCPIDYSKKYAVTIKNNYTKENNHIGLRETYSLICVGSSWKQRVVTGLLVLASVMIMTLVILGFGPTQKEGRTYSRYMLYAAATAIMIIYIFMLNQSDGIVLTHWGYQLLEAIRQGKPQDYVLLLKYNARPTNYSILANMISAISMCPLYIIAQLTGIDLATADYNLVREIPIVAAVILSSYFIYKLVRKLGFEEYIADMTALSYMISPIIVWGNISTGQVDIYAALFMIIAAYHIVCERYALCIFFIMASAQIKQFSMIFAAIPVLILLFGKIKKTDYLKCLAAGAIMPVISMIISKVLFPGYSEAKSIEQLLWDHLDRLYASGIGEVSSFVLVYALVCIWCVSRVVAKKVTTKDLLMMPMIITFAFQLFVSQNVQWSIYPLMAVIIAILYFDDRRMGSLIYLMYGGLYYIYAMTHILGQTDNGMINTGWLAEKIPIYSYMIFAGNYIERYLPQFDVWDVSRVAYTGLAACVAAVLYWFIKGSKKSEVAQTATAEEKIYVKVVIILTFLMNIIAALFSMLTYFGFLIPNS